MKNICSVFSTDKGARLSILIIIIITYTRRRCLPQFFGVLTQFSSVVVRPTYSSWGTIGATTHGATTHKIRHSIPHLNYSGSLFIAKANTLEGRRQELAQRFFRRNVLDETSCLHYLLESQECSQDIVNRLRSSQTYEQYSVRTEKFRKSFIPFSVSNYQ